METIIDSFRKEEQMKNNIVLIGMPGAGKSTAGVILAKVMGYRFLDADLLIQQRENALLKDIIAKRGIEGFIKIENDKRENLDKKVYIIEFIKTKNGKCENLDKKIILISCS